MGTKHGKEHWVLMGCIPTKVSFKNIFKPGYPACLAAYLSDF